MIYYLGLLWGVIEIKDNVKSLDETANWVNGDYESSVSFEKCIVNP